MILCPTGRVEDIGWAKLQILYPPPPPRPHTFDFENFLALQHCSCAKRGAFRIILGPPVSLISYHK